ncbi:MAG: hypothetical protein E4H00_04505 [Myxococcales bacterium]|nr:MAG: hypothetical protein E4H00_04505 [Myxococcales bacterium]
MYRRIFTKLSLLSSGALLLPACDDRRPSADGTTGTMSPEERVIVQRFAEAYPPTEGTNLKPLTDVPYLDNIDRRLSSFDEPTMEQVRLAFTLFNYGAIPVGFHFRTFVNLTSPEREAYIRRFDDGIAMQRGISALMKNLVTIGYWQDVEAGRAVGFQGPVSEDAGLPSLGNAPMAFAPPPRAR